MTPTNTERLKRSTQHDREALQSLPVIQRALRGDVTRRRYLAFLTQAYYHVRHTVPLLMAVGARLPARCGWLQARIAHYVDEELGHDRWILDDIDAAGGNAQSVRDGIPAVETDAMIAYAWDTVMRREPIGFFGMVHVLEGTSVALACTAADAIQRALALPDRALTYLRSHGMLDRRHVGDLASILDRLDAERDLPAVVTCARTMYWLYANVFRSLEDDVPSVEAALPGTLAWS